MEILLGSLAGALLGSCLGIIVGRWYWSRR